VPCQAVHRPVALKSASMMRAHLCAAAALVAATASVLESAEAANYHLTNNTGLDVEMTFPGDIAVLTEPTVLSAFKTALKADLATGLSVPATSITNIVVSAGSIKVKYSISNTHMTGAAVRNAVTAMTFPSITASGVIPASIKSTITSAEVTTVTSSRGACSYSPSCGSHATCSNLVGGGYQCECAIGYTGRTLNGPAICKQALRKAAAATALSVSTAILLAVASLEAMLFSRGW
jgi:hypothetical protein